MVAARTAARGLSTSDLERIRDSVAAGRKPKVVFTQAAGQMVGQHGQVVQLTDPQLSDEWLVVRFGRDELPFSPVDLAVVPRATPNRAAKTADKAVEQAAPNPSAVPAPREERTVPVSTPSAVDSPAANDVAAPAAPVKPAADASLAKPAARKAVKSKSPAALTVTLSYAAGEWTVGAQQGAKALAKPCTVRPAEALKMVALLAVPAVQEAVDEIVTAARAQAEAAADRLRSELAEVEARLAELRDTP